MLETKIVLRWDIHEKSAPYESDRWASSDRGWLFAEIYPRSLSISVTGTTHVCLGHYLDYERPGEPSVHAVSCVTRESKHFASPSDAQTWILAQASGRVTDYFAACHQGYEHQKDAYRRMVCDENPVHDCP
jgi:hypothetical protein